MSTDVAGPDGWYYHRGVWTSESPKLLGPADQAFWLSSIVFDGARAFGGLAPDLDLHCERVVRSAKSMGLSPKIAATEIEALCIDAIRRFPADAELYIRPMFYATGGFIIPDAETTEFTLAVYRSPMPAAAGFSACMSSFRRPGPDMAPTDAKASCLYPNSARAAAEAQARGFDAAVMLDPIGNVAEFSSSNLWIARDGVAITPAPNGTFLNGITRQRVITLLRGAGVRVEERRISPADLRTADEIFNTGNFGKVQPVTRFEDRALQPGPIYRQARDLYWQFAAGCKVI